MHKNIIKDTELAKIIRTLSATGYNIVGAERHPVYILLSCIKKDLFGIPLKYLFLVSEKKIDKNSLSAVKKSANHKNQNLLLIQDVSSSDELCLTRGKFMHILGGPIFWPNNINKKFILRLEQLGHNELPKGLSGKPDELFESYIYQGLRFVFGNNIIKYGADRRFEDVPDGIGFTNQNIMIIYDAKAYKNGFKITKTSLRQFSDYVNNFNDQYSNKYGRIFSFLVFSGHFDHSEKAMQKKDSDFYSKCQTRLCCVRANEFGKIFNKLWCYPSYIYSINWKNLLSNSVLSYKLFETEFKRIKKNKI